MFWALHVGTEWGPILSVIVLLYFILCIEVEWNKNIDPKLVTGVTDKIIFRIFTG